MKRKGILSLLLILLIFTVFVNGAHSNNTNQTGGSISTQIRKRSADYNDHSTVSCSSSSTKCTCENRPYEVKTGNDEYGFDDQYYNYRGPIIETDYYGNQISCFHYTIARIADKYDTCSDKALKSVIIGLNPAKASCQQLPCSGYQDVVSSMSCKCGCGFSNCCTTSISSDSSLNIYGLKFIFNDPIDTNAQEVELTICLKGSNHQMIYGGGLIAFSLTDTSGFACDSYNIPNFCDGPGGSVDDCDEQDKCVEFDMTEVYDYVGSSNGYQICLWWTQDGNSNCKKEDSISHFCYNPGYSQQKIEGWEKNFKQCVTVNCGETAVFGVKDGQGCNSYTGSLTKTIPNAYDYQSLTGRCSYKAGYDYPCPGDNTGACAWEIDSPICTPHPTSAKWPTDYPTIDPTMQPTDEDSICDCYTVTLTDTDHESYYGRNQTCLSYEVTVNPDYLDNRMCADDNIVYVILGTCYDNERLGAWPPIWRELTGCRGTPEVVDEIVDGAPIYGIQCKVKFSDPCDLNRDGDCQEDFAICIDRPYGDQVIIQQVGYKDPDATYICEHDGLPDLCQTIDPIVDPTMDPTINPTRVAQAANYKSDLENVKFLGHNDNDYKDNNNKHNILTMFTSYSEIILMVTIALNILICVYMKCSLVNTSDVPLNKKKYGVIENNEESSDDSDGTE